MLPIEWGDFGLKCILNIAKVGYQIKSRSLIGQKSDVITI